MTHGISTGVEMPEPCIYEGGESPLYDAPTGYTADQLRAYGAACRVKALEATQAEIERLTLDLQTYKQSFAAYKADQALARLAEMEKANTVSDQDINLIAHNEATEDWDDLTFRDGWFAGFKDGFRAAEVEHGIKERGMMDSKLEVLFRKMQADMVAYLEPSNECGKDWFVNRMIWHMDGPEQREAQGAAAGASLVQPSQAGKT